MPVKHADLTKVMSDKMKRLSDVSMKEVMDFIELLKSKEEKPKNGSPESILRHVGAWRFEKGELDNILEDIQKEREKSVTIKREDWLQIP